MKPNAMAIINVKLFDIKSFKMSVRTIQRTIIKPLYKNNKLKTLKYLK